MTLREVYGYGPGIKVEKSTLEPLDHYGVMNVEETGLTATQTSGGKVVPQRRKNNGAMGQIAAEMRATAASSKAEVVAQKETETREALAAVEPEAVAKTCEACSGCTRGKTPFCDISRTAHAKRNKLVPKKQGLHKQKECLRQS